MVEFIAGVCVGYFCRPFVAGIINMTTAAWQKYQQNKSKDSNLPK